jgi:hypothetical protein
MQGADGDDKGVQRIVLAADQVLQGLIDLHGCGHRIRRLVGSRGVAAPSTQVTWASWPQACITPGVSETYFAPVSSVMGKASISARMSNVGPGRPVSSVATNP